MNFLTGFATSDSFPATRYTPPRLAQLNLKAVTIMAGLHDTLKAGGYTGHDLERFLVRVLFCMFAENTHIFEPEAFKLYIENHPHPDGNDLGRALAELFQTLNTDTHLRQRNLDEDLQDFPYINGALFAERLQFAAFNADMRTAFLRLPTSIGRVSPPESHLWCAIPRGHEA